MAKVKFKVVSKSTKGRYFSIFVQGKYRIEYIPGEEVIAPGIGVMCFHTKTNAENFIQTSPTPEYITHEKCIIRVMPLCKATLVPFWPSNALPRIITQFIRKYELWKRRKTLTQTEKNWYDFLSDGFSAKKIWDGSVCYNKVKVIGE